MRSAITIAISGSACSGKTTLAYLLEHLLPEALVIQQDDFQRRAKPPPGDGNSDAASAGSFDMAAFDDAIEVCQNTGEMPKGFESAQDPKTVEAMRQHAINSVSSGDRHTFKDRLIAAVGPHRAIIVEGPLLYQDPGLLARANIRLFIRNTKALAKERIMAHAGDGGSHNTDPRQTEAHFENAVWPVYVQNLSFLFEQNDVEGVPRAAVTELMGVIVQPSVNSSVSETLKWAVDAICTVSEEEP